VRKPGDIGGFVGYKLRSLEGLNTLGVFAPLAMTTTYWTMQFFMR